MSKYQAVDNDHVGRGVVKVARVSDQTVPQPQPPGSPKTHKPTERARLADPEDTRTGGRLQNGQLQREQQGGQEAGGKGVQMPLAAASSQHNPIHRRRVEAEPAEALHGVLPIRYP